MEYKNGRVFKDYPHITQKETMILSAPARINLVDTFDLVELEIHELDL